MSSHNSMSATLKRCSRWLTPWLRKRPTAAGSPLPLGLSPQAVQSLKVLQSTPQWPHFLAALEALAEQQASEVASGLPHDRYLFASGALTALRRVYTLVDDLIATAANLKEISDARERQFASAEQRRASSFLNTPWYDGWRRAER